MGKYSLFVLIYVQNRLIHFLGRMSMDVGPCHRGMGRPQVVDGGTASNMEGSCE